MPTVLSVDPASRDNPAAVQATIDQLVAENYSGPEWVRQGPNFIQNKATGEVHNLNQEALAILDKAPARQDAVATIQQDDGTHTQVWIDQSAVQEAGNNLHVLKTTLQNAYASPSVPSWVWWAGAGALALMLMRRKHA